MQDSAITGDANASQRILAKARLYDNNYYKSIGDLHCLQSWNLRPAFMVATLWSCLWAKSCQQLESQHDTAIHLLSYLQSGCTFKAGPHQIWMSHTRA